MDVTNIIKSQAAASIVPNWEKLTGEQLADKYSSLLHDESKITGEVFASVSFPESLEQLASEVKYCYDNGIAMRVSAARTGLAAGAVPREKEHIFSLTKLKGVQGLIAPKIVKVKAGVTLAELNSWVDENCPELYFPVDPTELGASVAGAVATNAGGARSFKYGSMRNWVVGLTVVLPCGDVLVIKRGELLALEGKFQILDSLGSRVLKANSIPKPQTKNCLGYSCAENIDLIDVFVGSEGTLGIIAEVELLLTERPEHRLFLLQFFEDEIKALNFVEIIRAEPSLNPLSIEYCDSGSLDLVRTSPIVKTNRVAQALKDSNRAAVSSELELESEDQLGDVYEILAEILEKLGSSMDDSIAGTEEKDLREIKVFRHAIPESVNQLIAQRKQQFPGLHKLATDMAVPNEQLFAVFELYKNRLSAAGLDFVIFGHAGNNHFHVNLIPNNQQELDLAKKLYLELAHEIVAMSGAVSAEHGIGVLKKNFLKFQYSKEVLEQFKVIKEFFDPKLLLNQGVLFDV
jgi:D-lactate dehydrogenase (cytochrome)